MKKTKKDDALFMTQNTAISPSISKPYRMLVKPRKYTTPARMRPVIESYFDQCDRDNKKYSIEGLALHLGFSSTESLRVYEKNEDYPEFHDIVRMAKLKVQAQRVDMLQSGELNAIAGIFLLSNCHKQDYVRDPNTKENGEWKATSFLAEYVKPITEGERRDDDTSKDDAEANA